jgi:hypothetical protein
MKQFATDLKRFLFIIAFCFLIIFLAEEKLFAQNPVIEEIVEELASRSDNEDEDYSNVVDDLNYFLENPLNLNEANIESLEKLHFLNELQIENLLNYTATKGSMKTIFELQLVDGFEVETINKLLPFVMVAEPKAESKINFKEILKYGNQRISADTKFVLQDQKGYLPEIAKDSSENTVPKYQGKNMKYLIRYRFTYKSKIFVGITAEKDPGEKIEFANKKYGFDYYSFHLQVNNFGKFKTILVGDYQAKFGQGLVLWTGFGLGKSPDALNIRKKGQGIRYYSSTDENNFLRGVATTLKFGKIETTLFLSHKNIDANLIETDSLEQTEDRISTLQNTGYHRTDTEIQSRKLISESIFGSRISIGLDNFKAGLNFMTYRYDIPICQSDKPYKLFDLTDNSNFNASVDYTYFGKRYNIFGEAAIGKNGSVAILNGMLAKIVPQLSFSILHRYYQKDYQAYYAAAFAENTKVCNENGFYYGIVYYPVRKLKISAYADTYQFPWLKYGVDAPSHGIEYLINADYNLNWNISMYFRWRCETKSVNFTGGNDVLNPIVDQNRQNFRYHISYRISQKVGFRSRIEFVQYNKSGSSENGFMMLQDINIDLSRIPLSLDFRYCLFDATYNTRIYAYENDLLYNFSIPSYSGKGSRIYLLAKYGIGRNLDFSIRYSQFLYVDQDVISSGYEEIQGNMKSELKFQIIWKY